MSYKDLKRKTVIVTGGVLGIGREIVNSFAENFSNVVVADINEQGRDLVNQLSEGEQRHLFVQTNVTDLSSVERMVKLVLATYGRIDVLVNNAGINMPRLLVDPQEPQGKYELGEKEFDKMVAVNQKGPYLCTQAVVRAMINQKTKGVVVNIASECGLEGSQGQSCYAATKGALYAFTRSWAKELGKYNIRVTGVAPGILEATAIRTLEYEQALAYTRGITVEQLRASYEKVSIPLGRVGKLREIANLVCFLSSNEAGYITGTTYNISGGKTRG